MDPKKHLKSVHWPEQKREREKGCNENLKIDSPRLYEDCCRNAVEQGLSELRNNWIAGLLGTLDLSNFITIRLQLGRYFRINVGFNILGWIFGTREYQVYWILFYVIITNKRKTRKNTYPISWNTWVGDNGIFFIRLLKFEFLPLWNFLCIKTKIFYAHIQASSRVASFTTHASREGCYHFHGNGIFVCINIIIYDKTFFSEALFLSRQIYFEWVVIDPWTRFMFEVNTERKIR